MLAFITNTIDMLGLRSFCEGAQSIQPTVVRAFYEGRLHKEQNYVKIDRVVVSFGACEVNSLFSLPNDPEAEGNRIIKTPTWAEMDEALELVAKHGSKWNTSPNGIRALAPNCPTP